MPDVSITLPDTQNIVREMPPLLKLRPIGKENSYVMYTLLETTDPYLFSVVVDEFVLYEKPYEEQYGKSKRGPVNNGKFPSKVSFAFHTPIIVRRNR